MNKVILVGRLTRDPELRSTTSGFNTANFSVAVQRNFKNKDGNFDADFINCVAFRNQADFISKYFKKGNMIGLEGRIQSRSYDANDGTKRYVTEVLVDNVEFVGSKNDSSNSSYVSDNNASSGFYPDVSSNNTSTPEIEVPSSDPYEDFDSEITLSDNDLPF
ncbi:MAG: single-stranded DNA-binding protein [Bacilli bacterium]|nr:single-stranded DNA-binding protein [Bacilli bacterium]